MNPSEPVGELVRALVAEHGPVKSIETNVTGAWGPHRVWLWAVTSRVVALDDHYVDVVWRQFFVLDDARRLAATRSKQIRKMLHHRPK